MHHILHPSDYSNRPGGSGGGEYSPEFWRGSASWFSKPWPYFRPKYIIFDTLFQTWLQQICALFQTLFQTSPGFPGTGSDFFETSTDLMFIQTRGQFNKEIQVYFTSRTLVFANSHQFESTKSLYKFPLEASNLYLQWYSIGFNQL